MNDQTRDLRDLLAGAASRAGTPALDAAGMTTVVRRRRRVRAATTGAVALVTAAVLGTTAAAVAPHLGASAVVPAGTPSSSPVVLPAAVADAQPGACGWQLSDAKADGLDSSDDPYQLSVLVPRPAGGPHGTVAVETGVVVAPSVHQKVSATSVTVVLASDGVVVARAVAGSDTSSVDDFGILGGHHVAVPATTCTDGAPLPDGTYQVWAVQTVKHPGAGSTSLLGGGADVTVTGGTAVSLCGAPVSALPANDPGMVLSSDVYYGTDFGEPDLDSTPRSLYSLTSFTNTVPVDGTFAVTTYVVDATGHIISDGTTPDGAEAVVVAAIGGEGGGGDGSPVQQDPVRCTDGAPIPAGTYRAFVVLTIDHAGTDGVRYQVSEANGDDEPQLTIPTLSATPGATTSAGS